MINNLNLPKRLKKKWASLGFKSETVKLLLLVPPIQTGWADGYIKPIEQRTIQNFAKSELGIEKNDVESLILKDWFELRPTEERFGLMNELLSDWLKSLPKEKSAIWRNRLLRICLEVAQSTPQIGFISNETSTIRRQEILQIDKISRLLSMSHAKSV